MKGVNYDIVVEGKARIAVPKAAGGKVSSAMPVFYNPVMKSNRDITVLLMAAAAKVYGVERWRIADPMAATGIRGIRMLLELGKDSLELMKMNDHSPAAAALIKKNLELNKIKTGRKVAVEQNDANKFLLNNSLFSYIDIDPFGYPGIFLDAAVKRIRHNGIIAVTATDTSALAGAAQAACQRKYLSTPLKNGFMHETGLRIMVRLAQLIGAMHEKALQPVFSYYKDHYVRAFFLCREGAGRTDGLLKMHKEIAYCGGCCEKKVSEDEINLRCGTIPQKRNVQSAQPICNCGKKMLKAGPLWAGKLFDNELASKIATAAAKNSCTDGKIKVFLATIAEEAKEEHKTGTGFYAIGNICERHKIGQQPKTSGVITRLRQKGYAASPTHCSTTGVKTNAPVKEVVAAAALLKI
ncbi:tRNA (guanine(10)-N(2))-dimethyltransferase [Candidatus Woesearchaeota archaeon]|nr:tRNA (guanine(10)-N(2))-dimethyltransferase [Candidatus Woesearchaeota archaeon]